MLQNIRVVLIETSHPGNIGSAARAMKTMGLSDLVLVNPKKFPSEEAVSLASNATDVLDQARVVASLHEAVSDCHFVLGTSARKRYLDWPLVPPRDAALQVKSQLENGDQAVIVFGRERNGLLNKELEQCHAHVHVPSNPDYQSLNLAQAVQILSYEMRLACVDAVPHEPKESLATSAQMEGFYDSFEKALTHLGFLDPKAPRRLMPRMRRLFQRVQCEETEINILRGISESIAKKVNS